MEDGLSIFRGVFLAYGENENATATCKGWFVVFVDINSFLFGLACGSVNLF